METRAHYALVGGAALLLLAGAALFVLWLGQLQYRQELAEYDVVFEGPVRGVSESSEVRFNGIKVGDITRLGLDPSDPNNVIARIRIDALTPVKVDSIAQIEPQGITGVSYIQLTGGSPNSPLLRDDGRGPPPIIYAQEGPLEGIVYNAGEVLGEAQQALARLQVLMNDENLEALGATLENIEQLTATLDENAEIVAEARRTLETVNATAGEWAALASSTRQLVDTDARDALANLEATTASAQEAAEGIAEFADLASDTLARYGAGSSDLNLLIGDLRTLAQSLDTTVTDLQQNPRALIVGAPQEEVEVPR